MEECCRCFYGREIPPLVGFRVFGHNHNVEPIESQQHDNLGRFPCLQPTMEAICLPTAIVSKLCSPK